MSIALSTIICHFVFAQGETAVPFLLISSSPDGNGMGGIAASVASDNAMAMIANPGQLGIQSLDSYFRTSFYTPRTDWFPASQISDLKYNATAFNLGINFNKVSSFPIPLSVGLGYSRIFFDLGKFTFTQDDPTPLGTFEAQEQSENISVALGLDYYIRLGFGYNAKQVESRLGPIDIQGQGPQAGVARVSTNDIGLIAEVPVIDIISKITDASVDLMPHIRPVFDITSGYARRNLGDAKVIYFDGTQGDPLPRSATLGLSWKVGLSTQDASGSWEMVSFTLAREAEDVLVNRLPPDTIYAGDGSLISVSDGGIEYQDGSGDIQFFRNVILGESNGDIFLRKGWQLSLGEALYLRGGSLAAPGLAYTTTGFGIQLKGIIKFLEKVANTGSPSPLFAYLRDHIDVQFDHSSEGALNSPRNGTTYNGFNLIFK